MDPSGHDSVCNSQESCQKYYEGLTIKSTYHVASEKIADFIKSYEKFSAKPYYATPDEKKRGIQTIGYGHKILKGEKFPSNGITKEKALGLLKSDMKTKAENYVNAFTEKNSVSLLQQEYDALVSWKFNGGNFLESDPGKMLKEGNYTSEEFKNEMLQWVKGSGKKLPGLYRRRYDEWEIFALGEYQPYPDREIPKDF
nr:lysozyme [Paenibacillus terricola]